MASNLESTRDSTQLTIEELKRETKVTDQQLDTRIEQPDLPVLASYFDNINDGYLEAMNLSPGQQTDVREKAHVGGTLAGMMLALTLWLNSQLRGTFRALIVIFLSLGKRLVAVQVFKFLSKEDFTLPLSSFQERNSKLSSYKDYLQSRYRKWTLKSISQWPPVRAKKIIKLAMIQKEDIQSGRIDDEFVKQTITGKVDDILLNKKPIDLKDIFLNIQDQQRFVLIEGAPGSGTLALHICQEWAEGKLFQEFNIAILVRLRDPLIRDAKTIADILPCVNKAMAKEKEVDIMSLYGKGVLWVLDGWDELPLDIPQDSIINKLIRPGMSQESPLHESTLIVTSRPSSSAELHSLVSSRVEVLGFTPHQLEQYFTECLDGDSQAVQTLLDRIRENPVVEGSCYLPLNAAIVVNCFLFDNHSLPTSNYRIFKSVVQNSLKRYLTKSQNKTTNEPVGNITSPDSLPSKLRTPFLQMCQLSFYGIDQDKATFTHEDFTTLSIPTDISDIGLVQIVPSILGDDQLVYYCFLHLSIQELLAAIHISLMSPRNQISVFEKLFGQPRFAAVFQFYAGITKLTTSRRFLCKLPRSLCPVPASIFDLVRKIVKSESETILLSLMQCLYEAGDLSLHEFVTDLLNHKLDLCYITMNPIDCLSVGYFASLATKPFSLDLSNCFINDQGYKLLTRGLLRCPHSQCKLTLNLYGNEICDQEIHHIAELLTNTTALSEISLEIRLSNSGLKNFCDALSTNTSLTHLNLIFSLTIEGFGAIPQLLRTNTRLRHFDLKYNVIYGGPSNYDFCDGLSTNTSLTSLSLTQNYRHFLENDRRKTILQRGHRIRNEFINNEQKNLYHALSKNTTIKSLSLKTSLHGFGPALYQLLSVNTSLETLQLNILPWNWTNIRYMHTDCYFSDKYSCRDIAAGLAANKMLRILNLASCKLTDHNIEELSTGLINNIEELNIDHNSDITEEGMQTLARHLTSHCPRMKILCIPSHLESKFDLSYVGIKNMFKYTNKERKRNKLTEINVY